MQTACSSQLSAQLPVWVSCHACQEPNCRCWLHAKHFRISPLWYTLMGRHLEASKLALHELCGIFCVEDSSKVSRGSFGTTAWIGDAYVASKVSSAFALQQMTACQTPRTIGADHLSDAQPSCHASLPAWAKNQLGERQCLFANICWSRKHELAGLEWRCYVSSAAFLEARTMSLQTFEGDAVHLRLVHLPALELCKATAYTAADKQDDGLGTAAKWHRASPSAGKHRKKHLHAAIMLLQQSFQLSSHKKAMRVPPEWLLDKKLDKKLLQQSSDKCQ